MNELLQQLLEIASKKQRTIIGLMSGTSLDGLDVALCQISGSGKNTRLNLRRFETFDYPPDVVERLSVVVSVEKMPSVELCVDHTWLGDYHANLILQALRRWGINPESVDCIASHGQTVYHAPVIQHQQAGMPNATLQIGDGDHIARKTGILTISDFRQKHTAAGGEGAPMAALVDELLFRETLEDRLLLNIGGIANFTYLQAGEEGEVVTADTGPGNTLVNAAMRTYFGQPFDRDGKMAASGSVHPRLLKQLKDHDYFQKPLPKTTGPEVFNLDWVGEQVETVRIQDLSPKDLVATLTWLTAETIADAIKKVSREQLPEVYLSGGGMHNKQMMNWLSKLLDGQTLHSFEEIGFDPDAKEAVCFAVFANETLAGKGFLLSPGQGTDRRVNFGKISLPV